MKYDSNLYLLNSIRSHIAVITNTVLSLSCVIAGTVVNELPAKTVLYGAATVSSANGLMALRSKRQLSSAQEDVADVSDQIRTNDIYQRLQQGDQPYDYTAQTYNYLVGELGRGISKDEALAMLSKDRGQAMLMWAELEQRYGKLPTGDY